MSSFLQMKKNRAQATGKLVENLKNAATGGQSFKDDRIYYPERDAQGNGFAIIRFLPTAKDNDAEFVKVFNHGFKTPAGKWFIENCATTLGQNCPVCEANSEIYNRSKEEYERTARDRKRKTTFISNILVVSDKKHPENEGKVFLFKYGKTIFDMISAKANPPPEFDDKPVDVFSWDEGANFKLKIVIKDKQTNYDRSEWEAPSAIADGDEAAQEAIYNTMYDLREFVDPKLFKSFEDMEKKFQTAMGRAGGRTGPSNAEEVGETPAPTSKSSGAPTNKPAADKKAEKAAPAKADKATPAKAAQVKAEPVEDNSGEEPTAESDPVAYFRNLAKGAAA
jgi:hypothetical protein